MRARLTGAVVGVLLASGIASPVFADPAGPTDYRSEIISIEPPTATITVGIVGGDSFVELVAEPGIEVVVIGYDGEPYLWFRTDGAVLENQNSRTTFLNTSRFGDATPPAGLDPAGAPDWNQVGGDHRWAWHDHRAHWMQRNRPLGAGPGDQILESVIPLEVDGVGVEVTVISTWVAAPSVWPSLLGGLTGFAAVGAGWWGGRHRRWSTVLLVPIAALALVVGAWQFLSLPSATSPPVLWWILPAIALLCSLAGVVLRESRQGETLHGESRRRDRHFWPAAMTMLAGAELGIWGWLKRDGLSAALIPTDAPGWLDRYTVALAVVGGLGFGALALWSLFAPDRPDAALDVSGPTAATDSPRPAHP